MKLVRFVPLATEHVPDVVTIESESNNAPWSERSFVHEVTNPNSIFRVALADGETAGFGGVWLVIDEAHITTIRIKKEFQRQRLGWQLMVELLNAAKEAGMLCATLEVRKSNAPAIQLYERLGFKVTATRKAYYPDNKEDALIMWLSELDQWTEPNP